MHVLAFDTALGACSAAFTRNGEILGQRHLALQHGHAERLLPMVEDARGDAGLDYRDLDLIAVTIGPGTFTGVRIGLAAARALALPHATPVAGVGTLQAIAWGAAPGQPLLVAVDARRAQFYVQPFASDLSPLSPPRLASAGDVAALATAVFADESAPPRLAGSGGQQLLPVLAGAQLAEIPANPDAAVMARHGDALAATATAGIPPAPLYLRPPDAKLPTAASAP